MIVVSWWLTRDGSHLRYALSDGTQRLYDIDRSRGDEPPDWLLREAHAAMGDGGTRDARFGGYDESVDAALDAMDRAFDERSAA